MGYTAGPYAHFASLPSPARPEIHSSREVNFALGRYSFDATTGGFEAMSSVGQRVVLLIAANVPRARFVTDQEQEATRQDILRALEPVSALLGDLSVTVGSNAAGSEQIEVRYRDLSTGLNQTVQLT